MCPVGKVLTYTGRLLPEDTIAAVSASRQRVGVLAGPLSDRTATLRPVSAALTSQGWEPGSPLLAGPNFVSLSLIHI